MTQDKEPQPEENATLASIARVRRRFDWIWALTAIVLLFVTTAIWNIWTGLAFAALACIGLVYSHWFLLSTKGSPREIQARLCRLAERQYKSQKSVAFCSGWLFIISSPVFTLLFSMGGYFEYGLLGGLLGFLFGVGWACVGIFAVRWSKRKKVPRYLELARMLRESGNSEQPQRPASRDQS